MRLYLVRHGQTEHNRQGLALGREDVALNETGVAQAQAIAGALEGKDIAAVYSSPLRRCRDTADVIAGRLGLQVTVEDGLIEMDVGEMEGLEFSVVGERYSRFLKEWLGPDGATAVMPGGERLVDVRDRAWATLERLQPLHETDGVVVVSHNFVILSLLTELLGLELRNFRRLRHEVAAISRVEWTNGRPVITSLNDRCHLRD